MQKKRFFFAGAILCAAAAAWGYYEYQKPRAGVAQFDAAFSVSAEAIYTAYSRNEAEAGKRYNTKIIEVHGTVADVQQGVQGTSVLLAAGTATGGVNCSLEKNNGAVVAVGEYITVKGRCAGFLMDVSLVDAVLVKK